MRRRKPTKDTAFTKEIEASANGALARLFRLVTKELGYENKLKSICKTAQTNDKLYRLGIKSKVVDDKLEYRLYQMATAPKMTFDSFVKLISHLYNIVDFKFTVSIKNRHTGKWIDIVQEVHNTTGPLTDLNRLDKKDIELLEQDEINKNENSKNQKG